jgi:molybdopterin-binding protein
MKISARNVLKGTIVDVVKGATTAHVRIKVGDAIITASITNESVVELGLVAGMSVSAVIKASNVMVAVD